MKNKNVCFLYFSITMFKLLLIFQNYSYHNQMMDRFMLKLICLMTMSLNFKLMMMLMLKFNQINSNNQEIHNNLNNNLNNNLKINNNNL